MDTSASPDDDFDVFISRSGESAALAVRMARLLEEEDVRVFVQDKDMHDADFTERINHALEQCDLDEDKRIVAVLSPAYLDSDWCRREAFHLLARDPFNRRRQLVVLRVGACQPLGLLGNIAYWDLHPLDRLDDDQLRSTLRAVVRREQPAQLDVARREPPPKFDPYIVPPPHFTGRTEELSRLGEGLFAHGRLVLYGMGGSGKSSLAKAFASRHRDDFSGVWWLDAEQKDAERPQSIENGLLDVYQTYFHYERDEADLSPQDGAKRALDLLREESALRKPWLLVFDNADTKRIGDWLPGPDDESQVHAIITTRVGEVCTLAGSRDAVLHVNATWDIDEAISYLRASCPLQDLTVDEAGRLATALGQLPLALAHAAAYIAHVGITVDELLEELDDYFTDVPRGLDGDIFDRAVFATYHQSIERAEQVQPGSRALMSLASCLGPDDIPFDLLDGSSDLLPPELGQLAKRGKARNEVRGILSNLSLIELSADKALFSMHRLVQAAARALLGDDLTTWQAYATSLLAAGFPDVDAGDFSIYHQADEDRARCRRLQPHVEEILTSPGFAHARPEAQARLLLNYGTYLATCGESGYAQGVRLCDRARELFERSTDADAPRQLCRSELALAWMHRQLGAERLAETHVRHATTIAHGIGDPCLTAAVLTELGAVLYFNEDADGAIAALEQAVELLEPLLPDKGPELGAAYNYLGLAHLDAGRFREAADYFERDRLACASHFSPDHRRMLVPLSNGGWPKLELGDVEGAHADFTVDLRLSEHLLGADHHETAFSHHGLGEAASRLGRYDEAERSLETAVRLFERDAGEDGSIPLGDAIKSLADHQARVGASGESVVTYDRAAAMFRTIGESDSPRAAECDIRAAGVLAGEDRLDEALHRLDPALNIAGPSFEGSLLLGRLLVIAADVCDRAGRAADSAAHRAAAVDLMATHLGADDPEVEAARSAA